MKIKKSLFIFIPVVVFALIISVNFCKPFGFFRESNPAMVCINYNYWQQNPALKTARIPVESYLFDNSAKPETQMWSTVTSIGYGWFLMPYWFFSFVHAAPGEISIRIFSLIWLALTLFSAFLLAKRLVKNNLNGSFITYLTLVFYLFSASVLWYHVQGYVHEIAVLPVYFLSWFFFIGFVEKPSLKFLFALTACLFIAVQFDWLPCFAAVAMSVYLFITRKKINRSFAFLMPVLGALLGVIWIVYTYADWATFPVYASFLKDKFLSRTVGSGGLQLVPGLNYNFNLFLFYAVGYGLLAVAFLWGVIKYKQSIFIWLMIFSAFLHHLIFWGFSTEHDHAVIKMGFPIAFVAATVFSKYAFRVRAIAGCLVVASNVLLYFFLHNFYTRKGMYTNPNFCYQTGKAIHSQFTGKNQYVFINTQGKYLLQIEFYAGRYYLLAESLEEAKQILHQKYPGATGFFIDGEKAGITSVVKFQ